MKIKKILFVAHFDRLRFDILRSLIDLKQDNLDHVVLLNVIERNKVAMRRGTGYRKEAEVKLREKINIRFIDWAETLFEEGMEVSVHIVVGSFAGQIIKVANIEDVDLIVISPEKKRYTDRIYSGSDLNEIIRRTSKPVLVHKSSEGLVLNQPFKKLLFATSFSEMSSIGYIKNLRNVIDQVDIVYVAREKDLKGSSSMAVQKTRKDNKQKLEKICYMIESFGVMCKSHVYIGNIASEIDKAARECGSTMIIVGFPKEKNWEGRWTGSLGRELVKKSIFPVLLMPSNYD